MNIPDLLEKAKSLLWETILNNVQGVVEALG
jgi:hypothetical protein